MTKHFSFKTGSLMAASVLALALSAPLAQAEVPTATAVLGYEIGDDYKVADFKEAIKYMKALEASSDRIKMFEVGKSTHGQTLQYAVISSPENIANLDKHIAISKKLATARGLSDADAKALAAEGKIIIHIDGGMHPSEVAAHQTALALAYKMVATQGDAEVDAILDNVILILWPSLNPDGQNWIVDWYKQNLGTKYETSRMPYLYQEYVGHDNNRDGYMLNMTESRTVFEAVQVYDPVIWVSHHQVAPFPARIWVPPFADPVSSNVHQNMRIWTNALGTNMMARFEHENKPGAIAQARFDNWYAGFLDYTHVFRNTISFFTEIAHDSATPKFYDPKDFPENRKDFAPQIMYPNPWKGGWWRLKDSVDYGVTSSMAILDTGVKYREVLLYNRYQAGRDNIRKYVDDGLHGYVLPAGQTDMVETAQLAQIFIDHGLEVHQAASDITLGGKTYPAGSYVMLTDQAYSGLLPELLEVQKYPDIVLSGQGGTPADLPYDATGWTLPMQMGVTSEAIKAPVGTAERAALTRITKAEAKGSVTGEGKVYTLSRKVNASYAATNAIVKAGGKLSATPDGETFVVSGLNAAKLNPIAVKYSVDFTAAAATPEATAVKPARIGMYRPWGSNMDEGWSRWVLEQHDYALTSLYNKDVTGKLSSKYDTIILPDMGGRGRSALEVMKNGLSEEQAPPEYAGGIGDAGGEALKRFVSEGGTLVAMNGASDGVIELFDLPVSNFAKGLTRDEFFSAGTLFEVELAEASPFTAGLSAKPVVMFQYSPVFEVKDGFKGKVLAKYSDDTSPLKSGVAIHPEKIQGKVAALEVEYGKGKILLYGFEPQWRGQSHNTYKFVFNAFYK
ncbi:MAG: M14 metallopeptidase family protein [Asticcacaulis sp.]